MANPLDDPRIAAGMRAELQLRGERLGVGETPIGWKVGFGAPAAMEKLAITAPLVGFLTSGGVVESGATVSLTGWRKPVAEPEIAVLIGSDIPGDADAATVQAAIAGLAPAIELADLHPAPEQIETILSGNIFHRHVIVGEGDLARSGGSVAGLTTHVIRNGEETASQSALEANTGRIVDITQHVASVLAQCGEMLKAGEFIIAGSITPPLFLEPDDRDLVHIVDGLGSVSVHLSQG